MKQLLVIALLCSWSLTARAGFGYYSAISINSAQVPSTQTDFPVLVSVTDARFKTVGNGGHVQNANGFDIRPYSDSGLTTAITGYELERYNASTGEVVMWVKVGSLSSSTTPIYLAYGDSSISTDGSSTATWSNNFLGVYHLRDGTTLNVADSLNVNNGTNHSATAGAGQIDGCASFASVSSQYIALGNGMTPAALTYSCWMKATTFPNDYNGVINQGVSGVDSGGIFVKSNGKLYCVVLDNAATSKFYDGTGSHTLVTGTWYYLTLAFSSSVGLIGYVNAASDGTVAPLTTASTTAHLMSVGRQESTATRYFNGVIDEVRIASVARAADWITTEYNNQSAPGTFETLGTEVSLVPASPFFNFFR